MLALSTLFLSYFGRYRKNYDSLSGSKFLIPKFYGDYGGLLAYRL